MTGSTAIRANGSTEPVDFLLALIDHHSQGLSPQLRRCIEDDPDTARRAVARHYATRAPAWIRPLTRKCASGTHNGSGVCSCVR